MTSITWKNGGPLFRNGRVSTESSCCKCGCSGPCSTTADCSPGCICSFGKCIRCDGCAAPTNCTLTVTVTYASGATETLTYPDKGSLMLFEFGPCSVSAFYGDVCGNYEEGTSEIYYKNVELVCDECCSDGTGKNCRLGAVVEEDYHNDCGNQSLYITDLQFGLSCSSSQDPCNEFP